MFSFTVTFLERIHSLLWKTCSGDVPGLISTYEFAYNLDHQYSFFLICCFSSSISRSVDVGKSPEIPYVYILYNGEVRNLKPVQVVTACSLDIYNFPFDVQNCSLTFTSWLHNSRSQAVLLHSWGLLYAGGQTISTAQLERVRPVADNILLST